MKNDNFEKFTGSLGEFLEQHAKRSTEFYIFEGSHPCRLRWRDLDTVLHFYHLGVYTKNEEEYP